MKKNIFLAIKIILGLLLIGSLGYTSYRIYNNIDFYNEYELREEEVDKEVISYPVSTPVSNTVGSNP